MYAENDGYTSVCRQCINTLLEDYKNALGDTSEAIKRICMYTGLYYDEALMSRLNTADIVTDVFSKYLKTLKCSRNKELTYDDYLLEQTYVRTTEVQPDKKGPTQRQLTFWGPGFSDNEYGLLDKHYQELMEQYSSDDAITDIYIRDLCELKVLQGRALIDQRMDDFMKYKSLYQKTAKEANLNPKKKKGEESAEELSWGKFISIVEEYAPAEYYKDKSKYVDYLGLEKAVSHDILRPLRNLLTGSKETDKEYSVEPGDAGGGGDA